MKIAILHSALTESGGAERVILSQARYLKRLGHQVTCYAAAVDKNRCFPDEISELETKTYVANFRMDRLEYLTSMTFVLLMASLISKKLKGYDALICHHEPAAWVGYETFRNYGVPYICYIHHPPRFIYPRKVEQNMGWGHNKNMLVLSVLEKNFGFIKRKDMTAITHAGAVLVNSRKIAGEVENIYGVMPEICYPGVELPGNDVNKSDGVLEKLKISKPFILCTSRHTPHKRLDWLLEIFSRIRFDLPDISLVLVGGFHESYTPKLQQIAIAKCGGRVNFLRYVTNGELQRLYREASVYTFPAPDEDFGLGPVEAMLCGTPVVCWDDGAGPSETVIEGETGFRVTPYDLDKFAGKTLELLRDSNLREKMGKKAELHARENFSWEKHTEILENKLFLTCRGAR